jgi:amino acid permease
MLAIVQFIILLSSCLVSKNATIKIYNAMIVPVVLYGCQTCILTSGQEHGAKGDDIMGG